MSAIKISIINACSVLTDDQVRPVVTALQTQVTRDFAPVWGIDARLVFVPKGHKPDPHTWWLVLLDDSDQAGALGYHDLTPTGLPISKVFAKTDIDYKMQWSVTASHELLEMLADPEVNLTAFVQTGETAGYMYAFEMCDPVEDDSFGYDINGVKVSDFILPSYFQPRIPTKKWDFCGHLTSGVPSMLIGGYLSQFAVGIDGVASGWSQITANKLADGVEVSTRATRDVLPFCSRKYKRTNKVSD